MTTSSHSHPRGAGTGAATKDEAALLEASAHLTERDRHLVRLVGEHRVLTTDQLTALAFGNLTTARHRLSALVLLGLLRRFRPHRETGSAPWHYVLGPVGAALLGAEDRDEKKWAPQARADRVLGLERSQRLAFVLEYHTGSEDLVRLAGKLDGYAVLASVLADVELVMPVLLFCFGSPRREQAARRALAACQDSGAVRIATATLDPRLTCPAGPVWLPLPGGTGSQIRLIDLDTAIGDPWQDYREQRARERQAARDAALDADTDDEEVRL